MSCPRCPCPASCLGWPAFCEWAAEEPADAVKLGHIRARSAMGAVPSPPPPGPSAGRMAANLGRALWEWAIAGFAMADEGERARRLAICARCPEWEPVAGRCRICGCSTAAKVSMKTEHCPLSKW